MYFPLLFLLQYFNKDFKSSKMLFRVQFYNRLFIKVENFFIGHFRTLFQCQSCLPFTKALLKSISKTEMVVFSGFEKVQVRLNMMMLNGRFLIPNLVIVQSPMRVWNQILEKKVVLELPKKGVEYRTLTVDCLWSFSPWLRIQSTWIEKWKTQPGRKKDQLSTSFCYFPASPLAFHIYGSHFNPCQKRFT